MAASILIVEDEPEIQELLSVNLRMAGHNVVRADDVRSAQEALKGDLPDLVVVDWMLPDQSGIALIRSMRQSGRTKALPVIMLTARDQQQDKILGLESGADDYMTKPFSPRELLARIQALLRRCSRGDGSDTVEVDGLRLDTGTQIAMADKTQLMLGAIEFRLLHFFMSHPERVHTRTQLLNHVWGDQTFVDERTVDTHVHRLRARLSGTGHATKIETIRSVGYRFNCRSSFAAC